MRELGIFVDESGGQRGRPRFYLLTLVMHDQDDCIAEKIDSYERSLKSKGLPPEVRSRLLSSFIFDKVGAFKKNYLKQARRKLMG